MSLQTIPVIPFTIGLELDKEPFLLENDAFPQLNDCYLYQGRVTKKQGNQLLGRLVQELLAGSLGNTGISPLVVNIFTLIPAVGTLGIQPGSVTISIAAPIGPLVYVESATPNGILTAPGPWIALIDYVTGDLTINHPAGAASAVTIRLNYYTGRPVMGLRQRELPTLNKEDLIAFDTVKANLWNGGANRFIDISYTTAGAVMQWTATNSDFFWTTNYYTDTNARSLFWATNNKQYSLAGPIPQDGIQIYNGLGWEAQIPQLNALAANRFLNGCLILIAYRNRMVALNTLESVAPSGVVATRYPNRARWSQNGVPYTNTLPGFDATSWYDNQAGKGGYIDAPTSEQIVSCGFYKDTLVVFFERSTWALIYTGNEVLPFIWQRINNSYGCESTFSTVEFDKGVFAVGDKAIITSDSLNVERIDEKIPLEVFNFHNQNEGPKRVYGIRDYYFQFVYWTFPNDDQNGTFPNRMLVLNYNEGSYSFYHDSYTCFGYFQRATDATWATSNYSWENAVGTWSSARRQVDFPAICAGNQVGFVLVLDEKNDPDPSLYVTNITQAAQAVVTCPNHNLVVDQYVIIENARGMLNINGLVGKIVNVPNINTIVLDINSTAFAAYTIGGTIRVLNNFEVLTKKFNPFFLKGSQCRLNYADIFVQKTTDGKFEVQVYTDDSYSQPVQTGIVTTTQNYGPTVPVQKMWQRMFFSTVGQFFQFKFTLNDAQMRDANIRNSQVVIHAMNIFVQPGGRLT